MRMGSVPGDGAEERWRVFVAFWLLGGVTLVVIGIAMFAAVAHAHRVGGVLFLLGAISIGISLGVRRASQRSN